MKIIPENTNNQREKNCLGHMGPWLAKAEFTELAEHLGGQQTPVSIKLPPMTLNPTDERAIKLIEKMFSDLLPHFISDYVNINLDEPFGLGSGTPFELDYQYDEMLKWIEQRKLELDGVQLEIEDADTVVAELANAIRLIKQGSALHRLIFQIDLPDIDSEKSWIKKQKAELLVIIKEFDRLWLLRNRKGGLAASNSKLHKLLGQYDERLQELEAGLA